MAQLAGTSRDFLQSALTDLGSSDHVTLDLSPLSSLAPKQVHLFSIYHPLWTPISAKPVPSRWCRWLFPHLVYLLQQQHQELSPFWVPSSHGNWEGQNSKCPLKKNVKSYKRKRNGICLTQSMDHLEAVALSYRESQLGQAHRHLFLPLANAGTPVPSIKQMSGKLQLSPPRPAINAGAKH